MMQTLLALLEIARPKQWVKNAFVFAALIFAKRIDDPVAVAQSLAAFILFCLFSSCVYMLNDIVDLERDRKHPEKCSRPLPSGRIPVRTVIIADLVLFLIAIAGSILLSNNFLLIGLAYVAANLFYSFQGKSIVILDGMLIALGFVLRTVAGAWVIGVEFSSWLYICAIFVSLFLAFCKRRQEILLLGADNAHDHRAILREYSMKLLDQIIAVVTTATLVTYSLYCIDTLDRDRIQAQFHQWSPPVAPEMQAPIPEEARDVTRHSTNMKYTIPFVIYGLFRYLYLVYQRDEGGNPSELLVNDRPLLINGFIWLGVVIWVLYTA